MRPFEVLGRSILTDSKVRMGSAADYIPEKLIIGVLSSSTSLSPILLERLSGSFGEIERIDGPYPFTYTDYYKGEMGPDLQKHFAVIKQLVQPDELAGIKELTNLIEVELAEGGKRTVNLDPGLLSSTRLVLATTKDRGHRIPIGRGLYGEVTLIFMKGEFQPLPWTYADFSTREYRMVLKDIRKSYLVQQRC